MRHRGLLRNHPMWAMEPGLQKNIMLVYVPGRKLDAPSFWRRGGGYR